MPYIDIHDGTTHTLNPPTLMALPQTFGSIFAHYVKHPEYKSLAPDGNPCKADSHGLLKRYPVTADEFHLIGKETEHGWEQAEDISTLLPSLVRYREKSTIPSTQVQQTLKQCSLGELQDKTGLSRHTILRARRGQKVRTKSLQVLKAAARTLLRNRSSRKLGGMGVVYEVEDSQSRTPRVG